MPQFLNGFGLLLDLLLQFPGGFDFVNHFWISGCFFNAGLYPFAKQGFKIRKRSISMTEPQRCG